MGASSSRPAKAEEPHWLVQAAGRAVAAVAPWAPITPLRRDIQAVCFKDPDRLEEVRADPRRYRGAMRLGTALQFKDATVAIQASLGRLSTPFVLYHGTADLVTSHRVSAALFDGAPSPDKSLILYEGGWHVSAAGVDVGFEGWRPPPLSGAGPRLPPLTP
jgi:alpha-beta hydrolase superfamily lysophospholipase